jgi:hypothetical protein
MAAPRAIKEVYTLGLGDGLTKLGKGYALDIPMCAA